MSHFTHGMTWFNAPPFSEVRNEALVAHTGDQTDFWQGTYYGFHRDDGHFLSRRRAGDFTATVSFSGRYETLYDQAGLMVRVDTERWIKFGVEYTDSARHLSIVVTHQHSDWSAQLLSHQDPVSIRVTRLGDALFMQYARPDGAWAMARLAHFPADIAEVAVGPYLCSPQRAGFAATFHAFAVSDPIGRNIH